MKPAKRAKLKILGNYFSGRDDVVMAFLFGSRASQRERKSSDWDIGVYFKPESRLELETTREYPCEARVRSDVENILASEVDFVVLNRARPSLVFSVLNAGKPIIIKDSRMFLELLSKTHYEAVDFWGFVGEFWEIYKRAASLTPEARAILIEHLAFLENEFIDLPKFQGFTWQKYREDRDARRNLERWIENLVMSSLDIAKVILASGKKDVPQTYRETLRAFGAMYFDAAFSDQFAEFSELRNIIAHEYLDIRWQRLQKFIKKAEELYPVFIQKVKDLVSAGPCY